MFGWFANLFGLVSSSETASSLAKDVAKGVDMLVYTDEEKAIASKAAFDSWLHMIELMKDSETYRSITRRILAVAIVFNLLLMIWICIMAEIAAQFHWFKELSVPITTPFTSITMAILQIANAYQLGWVFCTIIVFYFGPHLIQFFNKGKNNG